MLKLQKNAKIDLHKSRFDCRINEAGLINPPFNYTGSKFRLLNSILPLFPKDIKVLLDIFCGGGSVGINAQARSVILNDKQKELIDIFRLFKNSSFFELEIA